MHGIGILIWKRQETVHWCSAGKRRTAVTGEAHGTLANAKLVWRFARGNKKV